MFLKHHLANHSQLFIKSLCSLKFLNHSHWPHKALGSCSDLTSSTIQALVLSLFIYNDPKQFFFKFYLFIYLWLCWVFVSVRGLSLVAASGGHSSSRCAGLSLSRPLLLRSTGSRRAGSVIVAHGPSCSAACGIFPDQGSNLCPLHWQADSQPLRHQGSPKTILYILSILYTYKFEKLKHKKVAFYFSLFLFQPSPESFPFQK